MSKTTLPVAFLLPIGRESLREKLPLFSVPPPQAPSPFCNLMLQVLQTQNTSGLQYPRRSPLFPDPFEKSALPGPDRFSFMSQIQNTQEDEKQKDKKILEQKTQEIFCWFFILVTNSNLLGKQVAQCQMFNILFLVFICSLLSIHYKLVPFKTVST